MACHKEELDIDWQGEGHFSLTCLEDEGIDVESPDAGQKTPDAVPVTCVLGDSGFAETLTHHVEIKTLEDLLVLSDYKTSGAPTFCNESSADDGFEAYLHEIYHHRLQLESKYHVSACLDNQPEISVALRQEKIKWLTDINHELKLCQDTLYLTVNIFDRVLDVMQVSQDCVELLGVTCMLVACKQNEICAPEIQELLQKCNDEFTRDQVKQLEMIVLMATSFDLVAPTVQQFLEYFAMFSLSTCADDAEQAHRLRMACAVGRCVLELSLQDYELCQFRPSVLALCTWNIAVRYMKTFVHCSTARLGLDVEEQYLDMCYAKVHLFIEKFRLSYPDVSTLCDKYVTLYDSNK